MRKIAKFTALTTLALATSNLAYADTTNSDTGLRVFGGIGGGIVTPSMQYTAIQPDSVANVNDINVNSNYLEGIMRLSGGMRYYFDQWVLGAIVDFNPISNRYMLGNAATTTIISATTSITNKNFFDLGGQIGYRTSPNTTFLLSILGANARFNLNDRAYNTTTGATIDSDSTDVSLAGFGAGAAMDYRITQHMLAEVNYRYITYNQATVPLSVRRTASGTVPSGTASFKPTQSMIDLSLVAEF